MGWSPTSGTTSAGTIHGQIYEGVREAILAGKLKHRTKFYATKSLAEQLNVSRMTPTPFDFESVASRPFGFLAEGT